MREGKSKENCLNTVAKDSKVKTATKIITLRTVNMYTVRTVDIVQPASRLVCCTYHWVPYMGTTKYTVRTLAYTVKTGGLYCKRCKPPCVAPPAGRVQSKSCRVVSIVTLHAWRTMPIQDMVCNNSVHKYEVIFWDDYIYIDARWCLVKLSAIILKRALRMSQWNKLWLFWSPTGPSSLNCPSKIE